MPTASAEGFMEVLQQYEKTRDLGPLVEMFDDQSELENLLSKAPARGREGARKFWAHYLDNFGSIESTFKHVTKSNDAAVLEWESAGTLADGRPVRYRGVSVLEFGGGCVRRFRAYYDSASLLEPATA